MKAIEFWDQAEAWSLAFLAVRREKVDKIVS
jgi:hypothetical protein